MPNKVTKIEQSLEQFVQELDRNYPVFKFIKDLTHYKNIPRVYRNSDVELVSDPNLPWLVMINGTVGSGKSTLAQHLVGTGLVYKLKTATTRLKRTGEDENMYQFMRLRKPGESIEQYHANLIEEYGLIESDVNHGNLYGLPKSSLKEALEGEKIPLLVNEPDAVKEIVRAVRGEFNVMVIFVVPDSWMTVLRRMESTTEKRDSLKERFIESVDMLRKSEGTTHFFVHNSEFPLDPRYQTGLSEACDYLSQLVEDVTSGHREEKAI